MYPNSSGTFHITVVLYGLWLSARLFQHFEPKKHVLKKASPLYAFGLAQNATFWKKLHFIFLKKRAYH